MKEENGKVKDESTLAFTYYELYRDLPPTERSLRTLAEQEVDGKKRSHAMLGKWSTRHNWQARVAIHDTKMAQEAHRERVQRQQTEIASFIDTDMEIALKLQQFCKSRLEKSVQSSENLDCREARQIALTYKESREWLKDLVNILPDEEEEDDDDGE